MAKPAGAWCLNRAPPALFLLSVLIKSSLGPNLGPRAPLRLLREDHHQLRMAHPRLRLKQQTLSSRIEDEILDAGFRVVYRVF